MTVAEMIAELQQVEDKELEVMLGIGNEFMYLEKEDMAVTTFGGNCDEFGEIIVEDIDKEGPTVFAIIVEDESIEIELDDKEED